MIESAFHNFIATAAHFFFFFPRLNHSVEVLGHVLIFRQQGKKTNRKGSILSHNTTKLRNSYCILQKPHQNKATLNEIVFKAII